MLGDQDDQDNFLSFEDVPQKHFTKQNSTMLSSQFLNQDEHEFENLLQPQINFMSDDKDVL